MPKRKGPTRGRIQRRAQAPPTPREHKISATHLPTPLDAPVSARNPKRQGELSELAFALAASRAGFGIARPFGDSERYDIILDPREIVPCSRAPRDGDNRTRLVRVQVKSTDTLFEGLYRIYTHHRVNGRAIPYTLAEVDFIAGYISAEDSWFIFPLPHILGLASVLVSPKDSDKTSLYDIYREAWELLREPDGLTFA